MFSSLIIRNLFFDPIKVKIILLKLGILLTITMFYVKMTIYYIFSFTIRDVFGTKRKEKVLLYSQVAYRKVN